MNRRWIPAFAHWRQFKDLHVKEAYPDETELESVLGKLLDVALSRHRLHLERYKRDLREFELRYGMESSAFYQRFESGEFDIIAAEAK